MKRGRALVAATGMAILGGCVPTGDGCPFGGCRGELPAPYEARATPPVVNPFEQGGRFRAGRTQAVFSVDRLTYTSPYCRLEAARDRTDASPPPADWRMPAGAIGAIYRVTRAEGECAGLQDAGGRIAVSAKGHNWAEGRTFDQVAIGPAAEGSRPRILDRR